MTKTELTNRVAHKLSLEFTGVSKTAIKKIAASVLNEIAEALRQGEEVKIPGVARFKIRKRKGEKVKVFNFATGKMDEVELKHNIVSAKISKKAR